MGNLFDKVISIDNLKLADEKARKGKLHSYGVQMHDKNREANILALHVSTHAPAWGATVAFNLSDF